MSSEPRGIGASTTEATHITAHGVQPRAGEQELVMAYSRFPPVLGHLGRQYLELRRGDAGTFRWPISTWTSESTRCPGHAALSRILAVVLGACFLGPSVTLAQTEPSGSVVFTDATSAPPGGVALPGVPTERESVHYAFALNNTFQNSCYAASYAGPATVSVNVAARTVAVEFDESMANYAPICPAVFAPVSNARIDIDPLPAGDWILDVDAVYDGPFPLFSIVPAQRIAFTVAAAPPVPSIGGMAVTLLVASAACVGIRSIVRLASDTAV